MTLLQWEALVMITISLVLIFWGLDDYLSR